MSESVGRKIALAEGDQDILACYPAMSVLRPQLREEEFVERVSQLAAVAGFQMAYLSDGGVKAVAGFRVSDWLARGKYLEIEDLVTIPGDRSKGYGGELFDWLVDHARWRGCTQVRLVSHVSRFDAHRFYLNKRMIIEAHYFSLALG